MSWSTTNWDCLTVVPSSVWLACAVAQFYQQSAPMLHRMMMILIHHLFIDEQDKWNLFNNACCHKLGPIASSNHLLMIEYSVAKCTEVAQIARWIRAKFLESQRAVTKKIDAEIVISGGPRWSAVNRQHAQKIFNMFILRSHFRHAVCCFNWTQGWV